jgi:hypothetical protein
VIHTVTYFALFVLGKPPNLVFFRKSLSIMLIAGRISRSFH